MLIKGIIRGFQIDRKRLLLKRTPLVITYPTVPKKEIIEKIIERQSVGAGGKSAGTQKTIRGTQRSSSSSSTTTKTSTSKKTTSSPTVEEVCAAAMASLERAIAFWYPALSSGSGGCSLNKY